MTENDFIDFQDSVLEQREDEIIDEQISEATRRISLEKEKLLALALARGYDGVDIKFERNYLSNPDDFKLGFKWEAWKGEPEPINAYDSNIQRYDFRMMNDREKVQLLSHVGITDLDNIKKD
jgi:hypothetical protein